MTYCDIAHHGRVLNCLCTIIQQPVKAQTGNRQPLKTTGKGIPLLFQHRFGEAVWIFSIRGVLFIHRKIIVMRRATERAANRIDRRCQTDTFNTECRGRAQSVVTAEGIIAIHYRVRMITWRANGSQVNKRIAAANTCNKLTKITRISDQKIHASHVINWWRTIDTDHSMALFQQVWDQTAAHITIATGYCDSHGFYFASLRASDARTSSNMEFI